MGSGKNLMSSGRAAGDYTPGPFLQLCVSIFIMSGRQETGWGGVGHLKLIPREGHLSSVASEALRSQRQMDLSEFEVRSYLKNKQNKTISHSRPGEPGISLGGTH